jgi:tripartite-type tricarboxylate transporter receptor subunit TctC
MNWASCGLAAALAVTSGVHARASDDVAKFYQGKILSIYVAGSVGGPYDVRARALEPYLRKYLPGSPNIVVQALPGAGGERAANNLYNLLPKDGLTLALLQPTIAFNQAVEAPSVQYDARRFRYVASFDPLDQAVAVSQSAPARTLDETRRIEVALGSSGRGSSTWIVPALMNRYLGTKFRIISGYAGVADIILGIERGELSGLAMNWYSITSARPNWQPGKTIFPIAQSGLRRVPELRDVPTLTELADSDEKRSVLEFYALSTALGVAVVAPPEIPPERLAALRTAFDRSLADPEFLARARTLGLNINPTTGADMEAIVTRTLDTPRPVINQMRDLLNSK